VKLGNITFAYSAIGWLIDPLVKVAAVIKDLGITGMEAFGMSETLPEDHRLGESLAEMGMRLIGSYVGGCLVDPTLVAGEIRDFENAVAATRSHGGTLLVLGGGRRTPDTTSAHRTLFLDNVRAMHRLARRKNGVLAFHPHEGTLVYTEEEIAAFVDATALDGIGLALDTAHVGKSGADVCKVVHRFKTRLVHIHLKDLRWNKDRTNAEFVELGRGELPLRRFLETLLEIGYSGWATIELDATKNPEASARQSVDHLKATIIQITGQSA